MMAYDYNLCYLGRRGCLGKHKEVNAGVIDQVGGALVSQSPILTTEKNKKLKICVLFL
jgi:hypothetical protein